MVIITTKWNVLCYFTMHLFYQACAPFWQNTGPDSTFRDSPVGFCAFSGQNLTNFQYTRPCSEQPKSYTCMMLLLVL